MCIRVQVNTWSQFKLASCKQQKLSFPYFSVGKILAVLVLATARYEQCRYTNNLLEIDKIYQIVIEIVSTHTPASANEKGFTHRVFSILSCHEKFLNRIKGSKSLAQTVAEEPLTKQNRNGWRSRFDAHEIWRKPKLFPSTVHVCAHLLAIDFIFIRIKHVCNAIPFYQHEHIFDIL